MKRFAHGLPGLSAILWTFALLLFLAGCFQRDIQGAAVSGKVSIDGIPLSQGSISFIPTDGTKGPVGGGEIKDGRYDIPSSVVIGTNRVEIRGRIRTGRMVEAIPPAQPGSMVEEMKEAVPPKFNSRSALKVTVESGENLLDFPLETK